MRIIARIAGMEKVEAESHPKFLRLVLALRFRFGRHGGDRPGAVHNSGDREILEYSAWQGPSMSAGGRPSPVGVSREKIDAVKMNLCIGSNPTRRALPIQTVS